jgi:hypothetical protein
MCMVVSGVMCCLASSPVKEHRRGDSIVAEHWRNFYKPSRRGHCNKNAKCWKGDCRCSCVRCAKVRRLSQKAD